MSRSRLAALILALLTAVSIWLSAGTVAVVGGDADRVAALPSFWILGLLAVAAIGACWALTLRLDEAWPLLISLLLWLPFLPFSVPSAFLLWTGPTEGLVWLAVAAGLMAARPVRVPPLPELAAPVVAAGMLAIAAWLVFARVPDVIPGGDEPHYLAATQSLLEDFDLRVANNYAQGDYLDYFPGRLEPHFLVRSTSGEIYSIHAPGVSVIVLPAFAVAGYDGAVAMMILIAAMAAWLTWRLAHRVSNSRAGAWLGTAAVFATAPYFFHTFTIYPEIIGSLCLLCGVWLLVSLDAHGRVPPRALTGAGLALAVLPWLHTRFAVLAGLLGLFVVARLAAQPSAVRRIAAFLGVPVIAGAAWFGFFYVIWGSPSPTAPYGADTSTSASYILRGLIGLAFDQQYGVLTTAPVYAVALAGLAPLWKRSPRLTIELLTLGLAYAVAVATYAMWWAGSAAPARFLVAILPLAALPIAVLVSRADGQRTRFAKPAAVWLLLISVALVAPRAFVEGGRFIYTNRSGVDATLQWLASSVDLPMALPSVHRDGGSTALRDAAVWMVALGVAAALSMRVRRPAAQWGTLAVLTACGAMAASTLTWRLHAAPALDGDRSTIAALGSFRPSWHGLRMDLGGRRQLTEEEYLSSLRLYVATRSARINRLPAGEYGLEPGVRGTTLALTVGRNDAPFDALTLDGPARLRLPAALQNLNVVMGGELPVTSPPLSITPLSVRTPSATRYAIRAARYGHARAFFFDDQAYPERDGFWTRANGDAEVVIDTDQDTRLAGLPITITAGAVETSLRVSVGSWSESFALPPGQKHELLLPPADQRAWHVVIRSGSGFRPSERDPGSRDVRLLAAWITIH